MAVTNTDIVLNLRETKGVALTYRELDENQSSLKSAIETHSHDEFLPADSVLPTITSAQIDADGHLIITMSDGNIIDAGLLPSGVGEGGGMSNPMTAVGDLIVGGASGTPARLAAGTDGHVLTLAGGAPAWSAASGGSLLVAETVVTGSAVTSVTFSGLDGNAAGGYMLTCNAKNATSSASPLYIFVNGDTTTTNYYSQSIYNSNATTLATSNANVPNLGGFSAVSGVAVIINIAIDIDANGNFRWQSHSGRATTTSIMNNTIVGHHTSTVTNITSLQIASLVSNSIAVGSTFRLYKRK